MAIIPLINLPIWILILLLLSAVKNVAFNFTPVKRCTTDDTQVCGTPCLTDTCGQIHIVHHKQV